MAPRSTTAATMRSQSRRDTFAAPAVDHDGDENAERMCLLHNASRLAPDTAERQRYANSVATPATKAIDIWVSTAVRERSGDFAPEVPKPRRDPADDRAGGDILNTKHRPHMLNTQGWRDAAAHDNWGRRSLFRACRWRGDCDYNSNVLLIAGRSLCGSFRARGLPCQSIRRVQRGYSSGSRLCRGGPQRVIALALPMA